jgi:hypothetical protein
MFLRPRALENDFRLYDLRLIFGSYLCTDP